MYKLKFLVFPFKIRCAPQNIYPAIECTRKQKFTIKYHSQPCILPITSHFEVIFIIIFCVERQNVVVKSDIVTMLKNLRPQKILLPTLDLSISIFWQFVQRLINFDVARATKQYIISWWVLFRSI